METSAGKRSAESEQSVDTFAFCTRCTRLSGNLHTCEKCGSALSAESAAVCYSAEPKRARTERSSSPAKAPSCSQPVNGTVASPNSTVTVSSSNSPTSSNLSRSSEKSGGKKSMDSSGGGDGAPVPVPQALYVNKNAAAAHLPAGGFVGSAMSLLSAGQGDTSAVSAQPQTLYMNMNGQNGSNNQSLSQAAGPGVAYGQNQPPPLSHPPLPQNPTSQAEGFTSGPHVGMVTNVVAASRPTAVNPALSSINSMGLASAASAVSRVSPLQAQSPVTGIGAATNTMMQSTNSAFSSAGGTPGSSGGFQNAANHSGALPEEVTYTSNVLQFPAVQIRIGARKFKPSTLIMVKDDGVLFTLKDYPNAPVLLNARAIVRCKMCLTANHFPVMFLQLEKSCMRQIRTIFQIHEDDFMEMNSNFMKTCITIFPCFPIHQSHIFVNGLRDSFTSMRIKYDRQKLLEEVSVDEVIDIMLAAIGTVSRSLGNVNRNSNSTVRVTPGSSQPTTRQTTPGANASDILRSVAQTAQQPPTRSQPPPYSRAVQQIRPQTGAANSTSQPTVGRNSMSGAPLLVVPNDTAKWQAMQKNLVVGGVYHVQMANGEKRYSLWNGSRLVPCLVQSSEVHMDCAGVRVGYLRASVVGKVRIKADQQAGIHFTLFAQSCGTQSIFIPQEEATCFVCFEKFSVLFIYPTWAAAAKVRNQCRLNQSGPMSYDPYSKDEQARNIILFLKDVNQDQRDALKQMKQVSSPSKAMLEDIGILAALKRLLPLRPQLIARKNDSLAGNNLHKYETIIQELLNPEKMAQQQREADNDDDDVIMTQEEVGIKCPYTQQVMKVPIRNKICGHNYEKNAIQEFILRKKGGAKCPYAGCGNATPLKGEDLEENLELKKYIEQNHKGS